MVKADTGFHALSALLTAASRPISSQGLRYQASGGKFSVTWFLYEFDLLE